MRRKLAMVVTLVILLAGTAIGQEGQMWPALPDGYVYGAVAVTADTVDVYIPATVRTIHGTTKMTTGAGFAAVSVTPFTHFVNTYVDGSSDAVHSHTDTTRGQWSFTGHASASKGEFTPNYPCADLVLAEIYNYYLNPSGSDTIWYRPVFRIPDFWGR